jgi:hypothetical protein
MKWKSGLIEALSVLVFAWSLTACALFSDDEQLNPQEEIVSEEAGEEGASEEFAAEPPLGESEALIDSSSDLTDSVASEGTFDGGQLPVEDSINPADTDANSAGGFTNSAFEANQAPVGGGVIGDTQVMYVTADGTTMVDSPNGSPVSPSLKQGDPVLTKPEGDWKHIVNRGYLRPANLSDTPIGRQKSPSRWR